jgi:hypothetical protein
MSQHSTPVTKLGSMSQHSTPVTKLGSMSQHNTPVTKLGNMSQHSTPVTKLGSMSQHSTPVPEFHSFYTTDMQFLFTVFFCHKMSTYSFLIGLCECKPDLSRMFN